MRKTKSDHDFPDYLDYEKRATLIPVSVDDLLASVKYYVDEEYAHIKIIDQGVCAHCETNPCLDFCPAGVFTIDRQGKYLGGLSGMRGMWKLPRGLPYRNVDWNLPRGGHGVAYKFG